MPIEILMPALSPTMAEGKLAAWKVKPGDHVEPGDVIAEIETDKATMEVEAVDEGTIGKIMVEEGTENVPVNQVIALLLEEGEEESALDQAKEKKPEKEAKAEDKDDQSDKSEKATKEDKKEDKKAAEDKETAEAKETEETEETEETSAAKADSGTARIAASPLARRLAKERGLDLAQIKGSGPHGRIIKADILAAAKSSGAATPAASASAPAPALARGMDARALAQAWGMQHDFKPADNIRKTIAKRLLEAKQTIPHFYLTIDCQIDALLSARQQVNATLEERGIKVSVNDFIIKAAARALIKVPEANAAWSAAQGNEGIVLYEQADISVAVATENGLITPIVKAAQEKSLPEIAEEVQDLARRAREGKLKPEEFQGGSFTLSNLGMYGIRDFAAIINPPQACILAVGMGERRAIVSEDGQLTSATLMTCTLSCDHRAVDGAIGAQFLAAFKHNIEHPVGMLV